MNISGIYAVLINTTSIGQIQNQSINPGIQDMILSGSGDVNNKFAAILAENPVFSFTTTAIDTALGACGINGTAITSSNRLTFWLEQLAQGGIKTSGSNHIKITADAGLLYPTRIDASQDSPATIGYSCQLTDNSSSGSAPFTKTTAQALSGTTHHDEGFTLGSLVVGATTIHAIQNASIDFGIQLKVVRGSGLVFPIHASIMMRHPTITLRNVDAAVLATIAMTGTDLSSGATVNLRKINKNSSTSTTEGMSFTMAGGLAYTSSISGQHGSEQMFDITLRPTDEGTDDIIEIASF